MEMFLAWQGWAGIGAIAQFVSLITLVFAVTRYIEQRRQMPLFQLTWDFVGTTTVDGRRYHLVEFRNVGRGAGQLLIFELVEARAEALDGYLAPGMLGSGEKFRLLVTAPDVSTAWVRWIVRTHDHRRRFAIRWGPLTETGPMAEQWEAERDAWDYRSYYERMRDAVRTRGVGPGGAPFGSGSTPESVKALLHLDRPKETHFSVIASDSAPPKLPYVPPSP